MFITRKRLEEMLREERKKAVEEILKERDEEYKERALCRNLDEIRERIWKLERKMRSMNAEENDYIERETCNSVPF